MCPKPDPQTVERLGRWLKDEYAGAIDQFALTDAEWQNEARRLLESCNLIPAPPEHVGQDFEGHQGLITPARAGDGCPDRVAAPRPSEEAPEHVGGATLYVCPECGKPLGMKGHAPPTYCLDHVRESVDHPTEVRCVPASSLSAAVRALETVDARYAGSLDHQPAYVRVCREALEAITGGREHGSSDIDRPPS